MTRELRANLIFFGILLVLILPGFVILMKKKLNGPSDPNYLPDPLPSSAAYIQPEPVPPGVPRVEPVEVRQWVAGLLSSRAGADATALRMPDTARPVVGDRFRAQAVEARRDDDSLRVRLLIWDDTIAVNDDDPEILIRLADAPPLPARRTVERIDVPRDIRHRLQRAGYIDPPTTVCWIDASIDASAPRNSSITVLLRHTDARGTTLEETITLPPL